MHQEKNNGNGDFIKVLINRFLGTGDSDPDRQNGPRAVARDNSGDLALMGQQTSTGEEDSIKRRQFSIANSPNRNSILEDNVVLRQFINSQFDKKRIGESIVRLRDYVISQVYQDRSAPDLSSMQTPEGSWPWKDELFSYMGLIPAIVAATMEIQDTESLSATIAATVVVIRYFKSIEGENGGLWVYTYRASSWLAEQIEPSQLATLLDQAGDLF
ncbi:hypothetical protein BX616_000727 [Lobosporangium transversale]|uniref:Uncharacterized protein n=1 Tax=Lobosporangium transversale TaxID=64571 RepID=A0A1Y2H109_9FUNG|nr:hypothetical protein BCR41DRAFT_419190 [Lobosporangium transversale]KAF9906412.1 hypothetical protein BX616_000727 [Lobosporangium transversale]ORZ27413.1 hypothetical protein BCR41DRAFT_419190 [Lobosporangium transversale]|eukprot:XP_021885140.1 hypothetical protein BCR41DRAFT_419190 [Lobosporangium transversale]